MAVYRWIYANAKMEGDRKDYHVRICDKGLEAYRGILIRLSNRLLSSDKRRAMAERQVCWFSGYLDEKLYVVAAGGDQRDLAGVEPQGCRAQHCVLAYGFTGEDIRLYEQTDDIFEPLKCTMRDIQQKGRDFTDGGFCQADQVRLLDFAQKPQAGMDAVHGTKSSAGTADGSRMWAESLRHPVMTGIISTEDAKKLLEYFPDGTASVAGDERVWYYAGDRRKTGETAGGRENRAGNPGGQLPEQKKLQSRQGQLEQETPLSELEQLKREQQAAQRKLEAIREEKRRKDNSIKRAGALLLCLLFFLLLFWFF